MNETVNLLVGLAMGLNLLALGSSRLPGVIGAVAAQGIALGIMPLLLEGRADWHLVFIATATVAGKGFLIPFLLRRAMRAARIDREIEPIIGFVPSVLLGAAGAIGAVAIVESMP